MLVKKPTDRIAVWVELERTKDNARNHLSAALANRMLERLSDPEDLPLSARFNWSEHEGRYRYGGPMGYRVLTDDGEWFNLEHLGRE
jgi:hypothetical protein